MTSTIFYIVIIIKTYAPDYCVCAQTVEDKLNITVKTKNTSIEKSVERRLCSRNN